MKSLLLSYLLLTQTPSNSLKLIVLNPNDNLYIVELTSPIKIQIWKEDTLLPISCLDNQVYSLKRIDFQVKPVCLVQTINQNINTSVNDYIILNQPYTEETIKKMAKNKNIKDIFELYQNVSTSITMVDAYKEATQLFKQTIQVELTYPFLIKTEEGYLPLSK